MTKTKDVIAWGLKNRITGKIYVGLFSTRKEARLEASRYVRIVKVKIVEIKTK